MFSIERKSEILNILEQTGRVDVNALSDLFKTSRETIRRDLREMEEDGVLKRTHGGAVFNNLNPKTSDEFPVAVREIQRFSEKNAICKRAAAFVNYGDSIFIDNSSTCLYLLKYIPADLHVTIITNSIKLLLQSVNYKNPNHLIVCLGGFFNPGNLSIYGNISLKNAMDYYPCKSFMSCAGIHPHHQLGDTSILEVDTKRLMIERSQEVFILADHSKFEKAGHVYLSDFSAIHTIITDNKTPKDQLAFLEKTSINLIIAE
jgi:DeoR family transcriptional regulator, fructose operon transcriptional repressor